MVVERALMSQNRSMGSILAAWSIVGGEAMVLVSWEGKEMLLVIWGGKPRLPVFRGGHANGAFFWFGTGSSRITRGFTWFGG
eukprot:1158517-Pelagomonas_calceolata.AAC.11